MVSSTFAVRVCVCACILLTSSHRLHSETSRGSSQPLLDDTFEAKSCSSFSDYFAFNSYIESVASHALECARAASTTQAACKQFAPDRLATLRSFLEIERVGGDSQFLRRSELTGNPGSIAIVSICYSAEERSPYFSQICKIAHNNFQQYSERHGYRLLFHDTVIPGCDGRSPAWHKVRALQDTMRQEGVEMVFWMDADSLFMNMDKPLADVLPSDGKEMSIVGDHNAFLNSGHFVLRNSEWSKRLLEEAWSIYPPPNPQFWWEQSALLYILGGRRSECREDVNVNDCNRAGPSFLPQVDVKTQASMNSYTDSFHEGDLVLHFAGCAGKGDLMATYAAHVGQAGFHTSLLQAVWSIPAVQNVRSCFRS
eukprot:TRINITY_DN14874_c1_g5_i1.p1 TRINITY_DN14874_c1_g5~~TRINITY_DN14874_c1_g5_i1.p1  ORF type:complete len:368 (+),score=39.44 TRINITY_DN14874_c1_g5_i1:68-1171(+)